MFLLPLQTCARFNNIAISLLTWIGHQTSSPYCGSFGPSPFSLIPEVGGNVYHQNVGKTGHFLVLQRPKNSMCLHTDENNFYNQEKGIKTKLHGVTYHKNLILLQL